MVGLVLFGAGDGVLVHSGLGNSPWTVLAEGAAEQVGAAIGTTTIVISFLILLAWIPLHQRPGLGTLANAVVVGAMIDVTLRLLGPGVDAIGVRVLEIFAAIALVSVGSGFYLTARLGPGPRDGLMTGLVELGVPLYLARTLIEGTVLVIGWLLGGTIGAATVVYALGVGPLVARALPRLVLPPTPPPAARGGLSR